jgi:Tfp pilus assembly protein PilF
LRVNLFIVMLSMLLSGPIYGYGQKVSQGSARVKEVTFIVRRGGKIKDIAASIKVPARNILKANKIRSKDYLAYPGLRLIIPVPVQPRTWDPATEGMTGLDPSRLDRHTATDFEVVIDTSNYKLEENFINQTDAEEDSVEYESIGRHLRKIDKRVQSLFYKIDSMKQVDFKFEDENAPDPVALTGNMKMSRDKYYSEGPLGRQIDSLKAIKAWLGQRRSVLKNQMTEYEYLVDNAGYSERTYLNHPPRESEWSDNLAYERIYLKSKDPTMAANGKKKSISSAATESPAGGLMSDRSMVEQNEPPLSRTVKETVFVRHKYDYALLNTQTSTSEIQSTRPYRRTPSLLTMRTISPVLAKPDPKEKEAVKEKEVAKEIEVVKEKEVVKETGPVKEKEVIREARQIPRDDKHTGTLVVSASERPSTVSPGPKTANVAEKGMSVKPEGTAATASDSVTGTKPKPVKKGTGNEGAKKPNYLEPVDSVTRAKGQFYIILAREALEKGDFRNGEKNLRKSLDINPNNAEAWMLHADIYLTQGAPDQSLKEYLISSEIDSLNPKVFYNIALIYSKNNSQKANTYFSKAIGANDKYLLAYMGRASLLMDGHDYDKAIADYDKVLTIDKSYSAAYQGRGLARMEQRKYADAIADFDMFLQIEKPDGPVLFQRGLAKIYSNDLLKGCLDLSAARDLGFKDAEKAIKKYCQ